jgi:phage/plasmid-like protein (TIGR03299 family)
MASGINENYDLGIFYSVNPLWHRSPVYKVIDHPVEIDEVKKVFAWEIEKKQLSYTTQDGIQQPVNAFALLRKDTQHILVDSVGKKFEAESNLRMVEIIENSLLKKFPELIIEGAGTLFSNKVAFIQMKAQEFQIKGDKSPMFTRMMYTNALGISAYKALVHNERVVCANTLRIAESEGKANRSLKKFSHLKGAFLKLDNYMEELAEQWLMVEKHNKVLETLAAQQVNDEMVCNFLKHVYPQTDNMSDVAINHVNEKRNIVLGQFNRDQDLDSSAAFSKYGLLQALTYVVDHEKLRKDETKTYWENIAGTRMDLKATAFDYLKMAA